MEKNSKKPVSSRLVFSVVEAGFDVVDFIFVSKPFSQCVFKSNAFNLGTHFNRS